MRIETLKKDHTEILKQKETNFLKEIDKKEQIIQKLNKVIKRSEVKIEKQKNMLLQAYVCDEIHKIPKVNH